MRGKDGLRFDVRGPRLGAGGNCLEPLTLNLKRFFLRPPTSNIFTLPIASSLEHEKEPRRVCLNRSSRVLTWKGS